MNETAYVYAVARIRANEMSLLSAADIEQIIAADNIPAALRILGDKGWTDSENYDNINSVYKQQTQKTWELLREVSPDIHELDFLIIKNDFHNLKAILKSFVANEKDADSYITPSLIEPELMKNAVFTKKFEELPDYARDAAQKTYEVLVRTMDGQLADIMLDAMALDATALKAEKANSVFVSELAELLCVTANIKIALRAAQTGKDKQFLETALCQSKTLDRSALAEAALKGTAELMNYLATTAYRQAAEQIKMSTTSFEKWSDDIIMSHVESAKFKSFGIDPLVAYYIAKDTEIKTIRIILSCKHNKLPAEAIKERVRKLYV